MEHHQVLAADGPVDITYLGRVDWGAGPLRAGHRLPAGHVWQGWVLHHTVMVLPDYDRDGHRHGDLDDVSRYMRQLQQARPDLGGEVPYPFVVFAGSNPRHTVIAEGRGVTVTGAHTAGLNSKVLAWAHAGDLRTEHLSPAQVTGMRWLAHRHTPHATRPTIGHRQAPPYYQAGVNLNGTDCPSVNGIARVPDLQPPFHPLSTPTVEEITMADVAALIAAQEETQRLLRCDSFEHGRSQWVRTPGDLRNVFPASGPTFGELKRRANPAVTLSAEDTLANWETFGFPPGLNRESAAEKLGVQ